MAQADGQESRGRTADLDTCLPVLTEVLRQVSERGSYEVDRAALPRMPLPQWVGLFEYIGLYVTLADPAVAPELLEAMTGPATSPSFRIVVSRSFRPGVRPPGRPWPQIVHVPA